MHNVRAVVERARARRRDAGALTSNERGCGRDADSNTRDVKSGAAIARGQFARSIKLFCGKLQRCPEGSGCSAPCRIRLRRGCAMAPTRASRYDCRLLGSIRKTASSFLGHHVSAIFELRAGAVRAEARRVERSESLDDVEHSATLIMCGRSRRVPPKNRCPKCIGFLARFVSLFTRENTRANDTLQAWRERPRLWPRA